MRSFGLAPLLLLLLAALGSAFVPAPRLPLPVASRRTREVRGGSGLKEWFWIGLKATYHSVGRNVGCRQLRACNLWVGGN